MAKRATTQPVGGENMEEKKKKQQKEKSVYIVFNPGTSADFVRQVKESIQKVTADGRVVISAFRSGDQLPVLPVTVEVVRRPRSA
jgi:hypothetical protein